MPPYSITLWRPVWACSSCLWESSPTSMTPFIERNLIGSQRYDDLRKAPFAKPSSYPGYFREPHWLSVGPTEIFRVTLTGMHLVEIQHVHGWRHAADELTQGAWIVSLRWHHICVRHGVSNLWHLDCVFNSCLFKLAAKKYLQSSVLVAFWGQGTHWWPDDSSHKGPVAQKAFHWHDVIMTVNSKPEHNFIIFIYLICACCGFASFGKTVFKGIFVCFFAINHFPFPGMFSAWSLIFVFSNH